MRTIVLSTLAICTLTFLGGCAWLGNRHSSIHDDNSNGGQEDENLLVSLAQNEWDAGAVQGTIVLTATEDELPRWWRSLGVNGHTVCLDFRIDSPDEFEIRIWGPQGTLRKINACDGITIVDGTTYPTSPRSADENLTLLLIPSNIVLEHLFPVTRGKTKTVERVREIYQGMGVRLDVGPYFSIFGPECDDPVVLGHISLEDGILSSYTIDRRKLPLIKEVNINWPLQGGHTTRYADPFFLEWGTGPYFMREMWYQSAVFGTLRSRIEQLEPVVSRPNPWAHDTSIVGTILRNADFSPFGPREKK